MASYEGSFLVSLDISHLQLVRDALKSGKFSDADWLNLGLKLGLQYPDLKSIKKDNDSNSERLMECLSQWLNSSSVRTWEMLASALEELDQATAEHIRKKYCDPASQILQHYSSRMSKIVFSISSTQLLYTEGLIMEESQKKIEGCGGRLTRDILMDEILGNVVEDNRKLIKLGHILMKSKEGVSIAQDIIKDCKCTFAPELNSPQPSPSPSSASVTKEVESVAHTHPPVISVDLLQAEYQSSFDAIRVSFGIFRFQVLQLINKKISSLDEFKCLLQQCYPGLESQIFNADSAQSAMNIALTNCNIINIVAIERITRFYKIDEAKKLITEYEEEIKHFCSKIPLDSLLDKKLSTNSTLTCETIRFVLDWKPDEHSLNDIRLLLQKAFADLGKRVIVQIICPSNSIVIICYAPQHLMDALILRVQENLPILIEEFSLIRLTIGHCILYDYRIISKEHKLCFEDDIELLGEEEQELMVLYKGKKESIANREKRLTYSRNRQDLEMRFKLLNRIKAYKSKLHEIQLLKLALQRKSGVTGQKEVLLKNIEEIISLQEKNDEWNSQLQKLDRSTSPLSRVMPMTEDAYIARFDYSYYRRYDFIIKEGEILELYCSLTGVSNFVNKKELGLNIDIRIPNSYLQSMLETLQLYQFIMVEQKVSLPILQKIKNDACTDDEKIFLFLECIDNDPILLDALRYDKAQQYGCQNGVQTGSLTSGYSTFSICWLCPASALILLPSLIHHKSTLKDITISYSPLPTDCIEYLYEFLSDNKRLEHLAIIDHSISDKGDISICKALRHNSTLKTLELCNNPLITSASAPALADLILHNSTLSVLDLSKTQLSLESLELIFQSLKVNMSLKRFVIDKKHEVYCTRNYDHLLHLIYFYLNYE